MSFLLEGITAVTWQQAVMYVVGIILIWLAVKKEYEPSFFCPWVLAPYWSTCRIPVWWTRWYRERYLRPES